MKIIKKSISEFEEYILQEIRDVTFARFPVRILISDDLDAWSKVLSILKGISNRFIRGSEFCKDYDDLPDITEILSIIKNFIQNGERLTFVPIQEILRGYKDINLLNLFFFETDPAKNIRLYLPFLGCDRSLEEFLDSLRDIGIRKAYPIRVFSSVEDYTDRIKFFVSRDLELISLLKNSKKLEILEGFCEYIKKFELSDFRENEFIVISEILFNSDEKIEKIFTWEKINNKSEFSNKILSFRIPIQYSVNEENYWTNLLGEIIKGDCEDFDDFLRKKFNLMEIDRTIFDRWQKLKDYEKWLIFSWAKARYSDRESYLFKVIAESYNFIEFEEKIWNYPIEKGLITESHLFERIELIKRAFKNPPPGYYEHLRYVKDNRLKLRLLTGIDFYEKREIIKTVAKILESEGLSNDDMRVLQENYPELFYYLDTQEENTLGLYIKNYIKAKILNSADKIQELEEISKDFELFSYPSRNAILEKFSCKQIWIDGLGVEWAGIVINLLRQNGYLVNYQIARANLPTTTEYNPFPNGVERFSDLDEIYHKQDKDYPDFLIDEIDTVTRFIVEKIKPLVESHGEILITSDHGSTRFSGWQDERIEIDNIEVFRNGRFAKCQKSIPENSEYYYIEQFSDGFYLISKTHRVFKGGKRTKVENHGGATIEESLVPIFHVRKRISHKIPIRCTFISKDIPIINPKIEIEYFPEVENLELKFERELIRGKKISQNKWFFDLSNYKHMIKPGQYRIKIMSNFGETEEIVNFKSGFTEEELI